MKDIKEDRAMTAKTTYYINHLPTACRKDLENLKTIGEEVKAKTKKGLARAEIRGYLTALKDTGVVSDAMFRTLYIYYTKNLEV